MECISTYLIHVHLTTYSSTFIPTTICRSIVLLYQNHKHTSSLLIPTICCNIVHLFPCHKYANSKLIPTAVSFTSTWIEVVEVYCIRCQHLFPSFLAPLILLFFFKPFPHLFAFFFYTVRVYILSCMHVQPSMIPIVNSFFSTLFMKRLIHTVGFNK